MLKEVDVQKFLEKCSEELKKIEQIKPPDWSTFVKTGVSRKKPPQEEDWWYTRTASVLRRIYLDGPVGVGKLRTYYGGKKDRGHKPERFKKASGNIIRKVLQQLEEAGFIEKVKDSKKKGRVISDKGRKFIKDVMLMVKK